jgi:hypothetical protein
MKQIQVKEITQEKDGVGRNQATEGLNRRSTRKAKSMALRH